MFVKVEQDQSDCKWCLKKCPLEKSTKKIDTKKLPLGKLPPGKLPPVKVSLKNIPRKIGRAIWCNFQPQPENFSLKKISYFFS